MAGQNHQRRLFIGCFMALVATALGFVVRGAVLEDWAVQFSLSEEQKGIINGVGLYPFAIAIILFRLIHFRQLRRHHAVGGHRRQLVAGTVGWD